MQTKKKSANRHDAIVAIQTHLDSYLASILRIEGVRKGELKTWFPIFQLVFAMHSHSEQLIQAKWLLRLPLVSLA